MSRLKGRLILYEMLVYSRRELRESIGQLATGFAKYGHGYIGSPSQDRELRRYNVEGLDKRGLIKSRKKSNKRLATAVLQLL